MDLIALNNSEELVGVINDVIKDTPELVFFNASPIQRNIYQTLRLTSVQEAEFRQINSPRTIQKETLVARTTVCKRLDASWLIDSAYAEGADWGVGEVFHYKQVSALSGAFFKFAQQIWYGVDLDAGGFVGFNAMLTEFAGSGLDIAASAATTDLSSVYAVRTGLDGAMLAWGNNAGFIEGEVKQQWVGSSASGMNAYTQKLEAWCGLQVTSQYAVGRIKNLSTGTDQTLNDHLLYSLISQFPSGKKPHAIFMTRRSREQLRASRTATNVTGAPAPTPMEIDGIPIIATDAIRDDEENLTSNE
jgi:hypothetical protein